ncbi:MAG: response regulator [Pseudomonadota bacterium]
MTALLIADDHAVVRQGLRQLLGLASEIKVTGEAKNGWEVLDQVREGRFDLVLLDMTMPGPSGVELIRRVRESAPRLPILVLTMHGESQVAARALKAGAAGYLTKDSEPEQLIAAIRAVVGGGRYLAPDLAARMAFDALAEADAAPVQVLSEREYEIFLLLARGHGVNDIADRLHLSAKTVSTHKSRLMQKLGLESLSQLVRLALDHHLVD